MSRSDAGSPAGSPADGPGRPCPPRPISPSRVINWQHGQRNVCVLDIPASLQHAQAFGRETLLQLHTAGLPSRAAPYDAGQPPAVASPRETPWNKIYVAACRRALDDAKEYFAGAAWPSPSTPPPLPADGQLGSGDRYFGPAADGDAARAPAEAQPARAVGSARNRVLPTMHLNRASAHTVLSGDDGSAAASADPLWQTYRIPPHAAYALGFVENTTLWHAALRAYAPPAGRLDLAVLDPPWLNASADRKASYKTADFRSLKDMLLDMELDRQLRPGSHVAVWVTNSQAARNIVLGPGGLFEQCDAALHEEWIWLKVTRSGLPLTDLNRLDRKPYEILLVGRVGARDGARGGAVVQRTILASPDVHSRKPNLLLLAQEYLGLVPGSYKACEIFARNLTAGWLAWGNECLLYNSLGFWQEVT